MKSPKLFRVGLTAFVLLALAAGYASAAKPGPGIPTGTGRVFLPNPVADLQDQSLTDQKDADYPALQPAYHMVTLTNLDGSGYLRGDWANIISETGAPAYSANNTFIYNRHDDQFEQVLAYSWVTEAQKYIQSLGFGSTLRPINMESQDFRINQWGLDNSFSWDKKDLLRFGKGGVDDAEDAEVILHEYGHAMMDSQMTPFGFGSSVEAGSIGEGFADYWAVTVSSVIAPTPDPACVADWDSVSYTFEHASLPAAGRPRSALPGGFERGGPLRWADLVAGAVGYPSRARSHPSRHPDPERDFWLHSRYGHAGCSPGDC